MPILVYIVLVVCGSLGLPSSEWYEFSTYSTPEKAQAFVDVGKKEGCVYSIHEAIVDANVRTTGEME